MASTLSAYAEPPLTVATSQHTLNARSPRDALAKTGKEFEAMFLRQTLESILPDAKSGAFGGGTAAGMWRSLLAEQVSAVLAERSVLGLANTLQAKDVTS